MNFLFVCSANRLRSRTAAEFFRMKYHLTKGEFGDWKFDAHNFDSCGTNRAYVQATQQIFPDAKLLSQELVDWADKIICMEGEHARAVKEMMGGTSTKSLITWSLPDAYEYWDTQLIDILNHVDLLPE